MKKYQDEVEKYLFLTTIRMLSIIFINFDYNHEKLSIVNNQLQLFTSRDVITGNPAYK